MEQLTAAERVAFDVYFSGIVSLQFHPANTKAVDLRECAELVMRMLEVRREFLCRGL